MLEISYNYRGLNVLRIQALLISKYSKFLLLFSLKFSFLLTMLLQWTVYSRLCCKVYSIFECCSINWNYYFLCPWCIIIEELISSFYTFYITYITNDRHNPSLTIQFTLNHLFAKIIITEIITKERVFLWYNEIQFLLYYWEVSE